MKMPLRRVTIHFNASAWRKTGKLSWTAHYLGKYHIVNHIETRGINWETHPRKVQPVAVLRGWARNMAVYFSPERDQTVAEVSA